MNRNNNRILDNVEHCAICGCELHREVNTYAQDSIAGRSHATNHHYVAKRFFIRKNNTCEIFQNSPWNINKKITLLCYECHEELLHNPVLLPEDICRLHELVKKKKLSEKIKSKDRKKIAGRVKLFHEIISKGILSLSQEIAECRE